MAGWIGRVISKVEVQQLLGRGGMAEVYLGRHITLNRPVAVKVLHGHLSGNETVLSRFRSEAQAVAGLRHPHIIQVFDFDIVDDQPYIVMELLQGPSLADYLHGRHKQLSPEQISRLIKTIAAALDYAHARGIVHRDVKPSNVLLRCESGAIDVNAALPDDVEPILTDFGVARIANATVRTASGVIVGTPAYMSPEQVGGEVVDARSDIYSLGVMLYEMVSGRLPFDSESETVASILVKHITESPPPIPETTPAVQSVIFRALAKDRAERYQKAGDLALDLRAAFGLPLTPVEQAMIPRKAGRSSGTFAGYTVPSGSRVRPRGVLTIGALLILAVVIGVVVLLTSGILDEDEKPVAFAEKTYGALSFNSVSGVELRVDGLPLPAEGKQYEAWLLGDETRRSLGVLRVDDQGNGRLEYADANGTNLLSIYGRFEITLEPSPDTSDLPSDISVYSGTVPAAPLVHIRHLLVDFGGAPSHSGLVMGLIEDSDLLVGVAFTMAAELDAGNLAALRTQGEVLVNVIEGRGGSDFGDVDGNGVVTNPADGFGLLPGTLTAGYIQTSIEHARYAASSPGATATVTSGARSFEAAAQNLGGWATQLRDLGLQLAQTRDLETARAIVPQVIDLADRFLHGHDANGNGSIEPSEGGAEVVYEYACRMADMPVVSGPAPAVEPAALETNDEFEEY